MKKLILLAALVLLANAAFGATPIFDIVRKCKAASRGIGKSPDELALSEIAIQLAKSPDDLNLQLQFNEVGRRLVDTYSNFKKVGLAYDRYLELSIKDKLTYAHLDLLVRFVHGYDQHFSNLYKYGFNQGLSAYPNIDSPAFFAVQEYFGNTITTQLRNDPDFTVADALEIVTALKSNGIRFNQMPAYTNRLGISSGFWLSGEIMRASQTVRKDVRPVEDAIIAAANQGDLGYRIEQFTSIQRGQRRFHLTDRVLALVRDNFRSWLQHPTNFPNLERELAKTRENFDVEFLQRHAKRVVDLKTFLLEMTLKRPSNGGLLLGFGSSFYNVIGQLLGTRHFLDSYWLFLLNPNMDHLPKDAQIARVREFLRRNSWVGSEFFFLLPSDLSKSFYTKAEMDYFLEDPRRLSRVTFILGSTIGDSN